MDIYDSDAIRARLRAQAEAESLRVTQHASQEMIDDGACLDEVIEVLLDAAVIENYPDHQRGSCCLVCGFTSKNRYLHVVCTTSLELAIIITVYEPKAPKWVTPYERRDRDEM